MILGVMAAKAAIVLALAALATLAGGSLVVRIFRLAERPRRRSGPDAQDEADQVAPLTRAGADLRGGEWIGMLERLAVFAAILSGFPEGIAVAMVLKGFARYPEIKAASVGAAERFIIGTFASVLFACAFAGLAGWLTGLF